MKCNMCGVENGPFYAIHCIDYIGIYTALLCDSCSNTIREAPVFRAVSKVQFQHDTPEYESLLLKVKS
jgi:hypothetical protein